MKARRLVTWVALPVAMAVVVSACGGGNSGGGSSGGTVTIGIAEPEHLLPGNTVESNGFQVDSALFTPLVRFDDDGKTDYSQAAAESITSDDKLVWTVKLRDGMTFHNGQKVTADSYIKAWNYTAYGPNAQIGADPFFTRIAGYADMQSPDGTAPPKATTLSGLQKVDDLTFTVTL
ncbi:MAG TPA: ABC transporter substrate-binding protein, partial [Rugosimonospora sp.]|nr:ABC transporter substrate-binding protein [Rugosimonospora sp.]